MHHFLNTLTIADLYTLKWLILWHVNFTSTEKQKRLCSPVFWASLVAQMVKNPAAMRETWAQSLGWEDPLEKGSGAHPSILAWRMPWSV